MNWKCLPGAGPPVKFDGRFVVASVSMQIYIFEKNQLE